MMINMNEKNRHFHRIALAAFAVISALCLIGMAVLYPYNPAEYTVIHFDKHMTMSDPVIAKAILKSFWRTYRPGDTFWHLMDAQAENIYLRGPFPMYSVCEDNTIRQTCMRYSVKTADGRFGIVVYPYWMADGSFTDWGRFFLAKSKEFYPPEYTDENNVSLAYNGGEIFGDDYMVTKDGITLEELYNVPPYSEADDAVNMTELERVALVYGPALLEHAIPFIEEYTLAEVITFAESAE